MVIVNSCTVTAGADRDAGKALRRARRESPDALLVLAGCLPVAFPDHPALAEADLVLPGADAEEGARRIAAALEERRSCSGPDSLPPPHGAIFPLEEALHLSRFNLKIQEGCAGNCAYCIVPTSRGMPKSREPAEILAELERAVAAGFEEVVLAGTNLLTYRWNGSAGDLADLMRLLDAKAPPCRIRVSSLEPLAGMERVVDVLSSSQRWCRHLHLSLQHADDEVLAAMGRPYRFDAVASLVDDACRRIPAVSVGMDVIVGFPTETEAQFQRCLTRLEVLPFAYLHVFAWSPRPGTRAAALPQLEAGVVKERSAVLRRLSTARRQAFSASLVGEEMGVLVERRRDEAGRLVGLTDNYVQVALDGPEDWMRRLVRCRLERGPGGRLTGRSATGPLGG